MDSLKYCTEQLEKSGLFKRFPNYARTWNSFILEKERQAQAQETQTGFNSDPGITEDDSKTKELKAELSMIYFQIDSMKELYTMQEKQLKGNVSEKQRLTIKNSLLSKAIKIQKLEQKAGKLEHELGMI